MIGSDLSVHLVAESLIGGDVKFLVDSEGEKNHKKGGLNCVFGNFFFNVLDDCPQVQSLSEFRVYVQRIK